MQKGGVTKPDAEEEGDGQAMLRKGTAKWQSGDKKYGLI